MNEADLLYINEVNNLAEASRVTIGGFVHNISATALGNFVGGALLMGLGFWYISKPKKV